MSVADPNRELLVRTARRIAPMLDDVVFVGGQVVGLLVTEAGAARLRPTDDVDVIVRVATRAAYNRIERELASLGFSPDTRLGAPICRFRTADRLVLDVMPLEESILGFSNRWYEYAIETASRIELEPGLAPRVIGAPAFLATKWEAFVHRGGGDYIDSHDVEDIIVLVAGRPAIVEEVSRAEDPVRSFITERSRALLADAWGEEMILGRTPESDRYPELGRRTLDRFQALAALPGA